MTFFPAATLHRFYFIPDGSYDLPQPQHAMKKKNQKMSFTKLDFTPDEAKVVRETMEKSANGISVSFRAFCKWAILRFCEEHA